MKNKYKNIVLKIGTNVLTKENGELNHQVIQQIVKQITNLHKEGIQIVLVSSGAMGAGRGQIPKIKATDIIEHRQILSAVGQVELMSIYKNYFLKKDINIAQILPTKSDFKDRNHYLNIKRCIEGLLKNKIIPILNENDAVSVQELMFTDNDELAGLIAAMVNADALVVGTNVPGVMDLSEQGSQKAIKEINAQEDVQKYIKSEKSSFGRGGMLTKIHNAQKIALLGVNVHICSGKDSNFLTKICQGQQIGTKIPAQSKKDNIKRWLAFSEVQDVASIKIDSGLANILNQGSKIVSILPIGITKIKGKFKKGDLLEILDPKERKIGIGLAEYSSEIAKKNIGKSKKRAIIHYNNLYINN